MTEKKKTESDSPRSERKIVLRNMQSSEYARKKYIIKKTTRYSPTTGNYGGIGGRITAEEAGGSNKDRQQRIQRANAFSSSQRDRRREKQAEYIKENAQNDRSESYYEQPYESDYEDTHSFNEDEQDLFSEKSEEKFVRKERAVSSASVEKDAASEKAERMKKASYIKEKLQKEIAAGKAAVYSEDNNPFNTQFSDTSETKGTVQLKKSEETEGSSYLGSSDHFSESKHKNSLENAEVKKAYKTKILGEKLNKRRMAAADMRSQAQTNAALIDAEKAKNAAIKNAEAEEFARDNIVPGIEMAAGYISAVKSGDAVGMITQPAVSLIKKNMGSLGKIYDNVSTISDAVQSSDSVGGAAVNAATSLAAGKVKSAVSNTLFKPSDERIEERLERKFRYIDRKTDKQMSRIQSEKRKALNGNISNRLEKELDRIERNQDKYKEKLAKQQKELQRQQQKKIYIKHNRNNPSFVGGKNAKAKLMKKVKNGSMLLGAGGMGIFLVIIIIILVMLMVIAQLIAPLGWLLDKPDSDPALVDADDLEKLCVAAEKVKKTYSDRIDAINLEISAAINDSEFWYEDSEGNLQRRQGTAFGVVKNEFWHYSDDETVQVGETEVAKKIIDELPVIYKDENPERWANRTMILPDDFDYDSISAVDWLNMDYLYEVIGEEEFDFYEFCIYFQVYTVKQKYPEDDIKEHMEEMFELNDANAYEFFQRIVKYKSTVYFAYHFATDTADGLPVYTGADPGMEQLAISKFQDARFWGFYNQCHCKAYYYDNCRGHQVKMFILDIVPYSDIFDEEEIILSEEDKEVIEMLKTSMEMLETEIIPEVMETYSGTYFDEPEVD